MEFCIFGEGRRERPRDVFFSAKMGIACSIKISYNPNGTHYAEGGNSHDSDHCGTERFRKDQATD